ncbi:hypothetical protein KC959_01640 [Candidatus Saccharibacteria bacterium]|nr:hypothetical protein [Candidatus Saccharibacteria bacterium]
MKKQQLKAALSAAVLGVLSPLAMVLPASAATVTWTGAGDGGFNSGFNWLSGGILVNGDTAVFPASANYQLPDNDMAGLSLVKIIFNGEVTGSSSKSYSITGNSLTITSGIDAIMTGSGGDHSVGVGVTLGADATFKTTGSNTLSVGGDGTVLDLGANDLTLDAQGGTISLLGKIKGSGNIVKSGDGKVKVLTTPDSGGYTGGLTAPSGEIVVDDDLGLNVTLSGGTLKGTGTVGNISMSSGTVAPGNSPGVLNTGNLVYTGGSFDVELGGTASGEYDQTNVTGTVDLGSATALNISLFGSYAPAVNDAFTIINNDGSDAVAGAFTGLANGDNVTVGEYTYQINYDAGDGNDVVLLVLGTPSAPYTGVESLLSSPYATIFAAIAVAAIVAGYRVYDYRKASK